MVEVDLARALASPGTRTRGVLREAEGLPVAVVTGKRPGPTAWVNASIHGDEYLGPSTVAHFLEGLAPDEVRGRLILTPILNGGAFRAMDRADPADGIDWNRMWGAGDVPPRPARLRDVLAEEILARSDTLVDLHSGGSRFLQESFAVFHRTGGRLDAVGAAMAKAAGLPLVWAHPGSILETSLIAAAARDGRAAALLEIGGEGKAEEPDTTRMVRALRGTLRAAGVLSGRPRYLATYRVVEGFAVVRNRVAGLWRRAVEPGADVRAGQALGRVTDAFGDVLETVESVGDGVVLGVCTYGFVPREDYVAEIGLSVRREGPPGRITGETVPEDRRARAGSAGSPARRAPRGPGP
ncbi:MAG: succinylglutamate desuccinylase/aspartoacylase family protein [Methanobacteriota archaeon]